MLNYIMPALTVGTSASTLILSPIAPAMSGRVLGLVIQHYSQSAVSNLR